MNRLKIFLIFALALVAVSLKYSKKRLMANNIHQITHTDEYLIPNKEQNANVQALANVQASSNGTTSTCPIF